VLPLPKTIYKKSGPSAISIIEKFVPIAEYPETILWSITGTSGIDGPSTNWKATLPFKPPWCHSPRRCEIEKGSHPSCYSTSTFGARLFTNSFHLAPASVVLGGGGRFEDVLSNTCVAETHKESRQLK